MNEGNSYSRSKKSNIKIFDLNFEIQATNATYMISARCYLQWEEGKNSKKYDKNSEKKTILNNCALTKRNKETLKEASMKIE